MAATVGRVRSPALRLRGACLLVAAALGATTLTGPPEAPEPIQNRRTTVEATDANPARRTLAVTSEGLAGIGATEWQAAGHTGAGTKVAIIDLGFDGWEDLPEGELPAGVEAMGFDSTGALDTGTDHGTQMAEIIHDVAPDAKLVLVTFNDNYMDEMVTWLLANEVDVVSMSLEWTDGPLDGTHWSSEHIQRGIDAGITWVVAAGNSAKRHHVGTTADVDGDGWVELDSVSTEFNEFHMAAGAIANLLLTWDDAATDLDLCVFDMETLTEGEPTQVDCANAPQGGGELAIETLTITNTNDASRRFGYSINHFSGDEVIYDTRIWGSGYLQFWNPAASIGVPANMTDALTVGAVAWNTLDLQPYSGWGPNMQGVLKPDVVAPDQITTSQWAGVSNTGTSYAAPHVAGIAALMIGAMPDLTPAQVKQRLKDRASQADAPDHRQGWGLVALGSLPSSIVAIRGHWAETSIDWAFTTGVTTACPTGEATEGSTCPELPVTRDEMAQFMWRSKGRPAPTTTAAFEDVAADATYGTAVDWLAEQEITLGCTTTTYCPEGTVTRAEMAAFLWRLEGSPEGSVPAGFGDVASGAFFYDAADWLLASGVTNGCTTVNYCPQGLVSRAEMFTFLRRVDDLD
ncbi:MAG: S8 family serine peptidase [Gemmatimonadales bacterium]|nr:S8 family serine peptidase [Gemmatimonadales bacterium]